MAIPKKVINFLEKGKALPAACLPDRQGRQVKYEILKHRTVYTAFDKAKTLKISEKMVGKTLVLKMNPVGSRRLSFGASGKLAVVLIPANKKLDKGKIKKFVKTKKIEFASERLIKNKFKARLPRYAKHCGQGVKVGAIPPFGNLWGLRTFIDNFLMREKEIILNSGDYNFSIKISSNQLKKILPDAIFGNFSEKKK